MQHWIELLADANLQWVLAGTTLLGMISGWLSVFTVLRQQSLLGDVMAHAALPGVCISYLLFGMKSMPIFLMGALLSGLMAAWCIQLIISYSRLRHDAALGIVLSVFFGLGIVLLTYIQQQPDGNQAGIDRFLFGQAASLVNSDVRFIALFAGIAFVVTLIFWRPFKLICFDLNYARSMAVPVKTYHYLLNTLIAAAVIVGIQIVGVVLIAALLIAPALAARYWVKSLRSMIILSTVLGGLSGFAGTIISVAIGDVPTGPVIILVSTCMFLLSALFSPKKGWLRIRRMNGKSKEGNRHVL